MVPLTRLEPTLTLVRTLGGFLFFLFFWWRLCIARQHILLKFYVGDHVHDAADLNATLPRLITLTMNNQRVVQRKSRGLNVGRCVFAGVNAGRPCWSVLCLL
jgi:hypothetical protein